MTARARITAAADGSLSVRELAQVGGCSESYAQRLVLDDGLPVRATSVKAGVIGLADGVRTAPQIALILGARPAWVREVANDLGLPVPKRGVACAADFENQLRRLASPRRSVGAIADRVGAPYTTVQRWMARLELPFKRLRAGRRRRTDFDDRLRQVASPDLSLTRIARLVGAARATTRNRLVRLGLPFKQRRPDRLNSEKTDG